MDLHAGASADMAARAALETAPGAARPSAGDSPGKMPY
jgi:hypothetical protein